LSCAAVEQQENTLTSVKSVSETRVHRSVTPSEGAKMIAEWIPFTNSAGDDPDMFFYGQTHSEEYLASIDLKENVICLDIGPTRGLYVDIDETDPIEDLKWMVENFYGQA
jgi:hypothetical protein